MYHRTSMSAEERFARSKLAKIIHDKSYIEGSLLESKITCGNKNCKCAKGEKHPVLYLAYKEGADRKMLFIPRTLRADMRLAVASYKEARKLSHMISTANLKRILRMK